MCVCGGGGWSIHRKQLDFDSDGQLFPHHHTTAPRYGGRTHVCAEYPWPKVTLVSRTPHRSTAVSEADGRPARDGVSQLLKAGTEKTYHSAR